MKLNKWLYGAAAALMLGACSDNLDDGPNDPSGGRFETTEGSGYIGINLQLPQQRSTRAEYDGNPNDVFDDGLASEYSVDNAALLLFWGPAGKEAEAEFIGAYEIGSDERFDQPNGDNITTSFQNVATLNKKIEADDEMQLWGMAIVNYDDKVFVIDSESTGNDTYGALKVVAKTITQDTETTAAVINATVTDGIEIPVKKAEIKDDSGEVVQVAQAGMKFKDFRLLVSDQALYNTTTKSKFFMTNAPLSNKQGENVNPAAGETYDIQTLAKLDVEKIFESESKARLNPAGCIFVERAVAKVTLSKFPLSAKFKYQNLTQSDDGTIVAGEMSDVTLTVKELGWLLDNEQEDSYFVRNAQKTVDTNDIWTLNSLTSGNSRRWRFVGGEVMNAPEIDDSDITVDHDWYRTYWCLDPNYYYDKNYNEQATVNSTYTNLLKTVKDETGNDVSVLNTDVAVLYPRENTFSVKNQNYKNTSRVVFRVRYEWIENGSPITVFCKAGDPSVIYKVNEAQMLLKAPFISSNTIHDFVLNNIDLDKAKNLGIAEEIVTEGRVTYKISYGIKDFHFTWKNYNSTDNGRLYQIDNVELEHDGNLINCLKTGYEAAAATAIASAINDANKEVKIRSFASETEGTSSQRNVCFYATNIKHFGDYYCPMPQDADGNPTYNGITTDKVYPSFDRAKYLGRWGMVRNNWYDLSINNIFNMGFADVPDGNVTTSDDNNEELYYISAKVHILSWAKRTQGVDF